MLCLELQVFLSHSTQRGAGWSHPAGKPQEAAEDCEGKTLTGCPDTWGWESLLCLLAKVPEVMEPLASQASVLRAQIPGFERKPELCSVEGLAAP